MRSLRSLLLVLPILALAGCPDSHGVHEDGGMRVDGGPCGGGGGGGLICVSDCGSDFGEPPICSAGAWTCPPGTRDIHTCPPTCWGPPPGDCTCEGTEWVCEPMRCPPDVNPWNSEDPGNVCSPDGATCNGGSSDSCGGGLWCNCESGRWSCAVAEPDPVCWCGREPEVGDRCNEEGMMCGECCPTAGGTGWEAMTCVDGHWAPAACPEIVCPPVVVSCPVNTDTLLGRPCDLSGAECGDVCCSNSVRCEGGTWVPGPDADCFTCNSYACGGGLCRDDQFCNGSCGPDDGIDYDCRPLPTECRDCSCLDIPPGHTCTMMDGHPHVRELGFCG